MKKALKTVCIVLSVLVIGVIVLFRILGNAPSPTDNYYEKLKTGGEIEARYLAQEVYETAYYEETTMQWFGKYEIWYPKELESSDQTYPVIVVCNGTGWKASKSKNIYSHYASRGFIVIGTEETYSWNAFGAEMCIRHLERLNENEMYNDKPNLFFQKIDFANVGVIGHSQGGVGVINAITNTDRKDVYKTAIALSPTNKELALALEWPYDASKIDIPVMIISGAGGGDDWVITGEQLEELGKDIPSDKLIMRRKDTPHGETQYSNDGYVMAWFMWQLKGDEEAAKAFTGRQPEVLNNPLYTDQIIDLED